MTSRIGSPAVSFASATRTSAWPATTARSCALTTPHRHVLFSLAWHPSAGTASRLVPLSPQAAAPSVPRRTTARERAKKPIGRRMGIVLLAHLFDLAEQLFLFEFANSVRNNLFA